MPTITEIQNLVNEAQRLVVSEAEEKIKEENLERVKNVLWPQIKTAIGEYTDLSSEDRMKLALLIHDRLDVLGLQAGGHPVPINVMSLIHLIENDSDQPDSQEEESFLPWIP